MKSYVIGSRMMGGGFGGMILVLVENDGVLPQHPLLVPSKAGFIEELF